MQKGKIVNGWFRRSITMNLELKRRSVVNLLVHLYDFLSIAADDLEAILDLSLGGFYIDIKKILLIYFLDFVAFGTFL